MSGAGPTFEVVRFCRVDGRSLGAYPCGPAHAIPNAHMYLTPEVYEGSSNVSWHVEIPACPPGLKPKRGTFYGIEAWRQNCNDTHRRLCVPKARFERVERQAWQFVAVGVSPALAARVSCGLDASVFRDYYGPNSTTGVCWFEQYDVEATP